MNDTAKIKDERGFWFAIVDVAVLWDPQLSPSDKAVYGVLCTFSPVGDRREIFPSIALIAQKTHCSENTVRRSLKTLIERGIIEREDRFRDGRQTSCLYKIIGLSKSTHEEAGASKSAPEAGVQNLKPRGSNSEGGRVQNLNPGGAKSGRAELEPNELEPKELKPPISPKGGERDPALESEESKPNALEVFLRDQKQPPGYSEDFEKFWKIYPNDRNKKGAFRKWLACLRAGADPGALIRAATRYAEECRERCTDKRYTLHASTFLGPNDRWREYDAPEVIMGRTMREVDVNDFRKEDGSIDANAYTRARRGLDPYTPRGHSQVHRGL